MATYAVLIVLLLSSTFYLGYRLYRLEQIVKEAGGAQCGDTLFSQFEALAGLYVDLRPASSLPPTRGWASSPDFLAVLAKHVMNHSPETVLECSSGVSTIVLARCLQKNGSGHLYSLEHEPAYAEKTMANLRRHGLENWATVVIAPLKEYSLGSESYSWYDLERLPEQPLDMLVIDGPPHHIGKLARYPAGPLLFPHLRQGGAAILDDASRHQEKQIVQRWASEFPSARVEYHDCEKGCAQVTPFPLSES